ncbi:MAG: DUF2848 domain-containing protein [Candidatus Competibacterales bacterium]|nr:DUF2848 domain-containing protein [Candidatus Competibacterales bacterium]
MPSPRAHTLRFTGPSGEVVAIALTTGLVAGWTGRDRDAVERHIEELAALGVPPPSRVPLYYRVAASLFTNEGQIQVVGDSSSGEVEPALLDDGERLWLGLGSDHTDRDLESHSVALAKQVCAKPLAPGVWPFAEVAGHLDRLELRAWIRQPDSDWTPYQSGTLAALRPLAELIRGAPPGAHAPQRLAPGCVMLCGTLPVLDGSIRPAAAFRMALTDPLLGREIRHEYRIETLPAVR